MTKDCFQKRKGQTNWTDAECIFLISFLVSFSLIFSALDQVKNLEQGKIIGSLEDLGYWDQEFFFLCWSDLLFFFKGEVLGDFSSSVKGSERREKEQYRSTTCTYHRQKMNSTKKPGWIKGWRSHWKAQPGLWDTSWRSSLENSLFLFLVLNMGSWENHVQHMNVFKVCSEAGQ